MSEATERVISGLEGVLACESQIAYIDGSAPELSYRGYDIADVVRALSYEQVVFLLWHDRIPQGEELRAFEAELASLRPVPQSVLEMLKALPASAHPMASLRTAVSMLGALDERAEDCSPPELLRKAKTLTAQLPTLVAAQARLHRGLAPIAPDPSLSHAANYAYMLSGERPDVTTARTLETALILYAEHETNASTFACRVVVGTQSDYYSAVVAGIGALKGPLHGGAIDDVMRMLMDIGAPERAAAYVDEALAAKRKLPGFGHRVYRAGDPRAALLRGMAQQLSAARGDEKWFAIATAAEQRMRQSKGIIPNVDYYAAPVFYHLGVPLNLFTNVIASTRIVGWSAHIMEQYANNRLIRPRALYTGPRGRKLNVAS
ncbi:MAG: citrate synthase [Candidatus Tectimicrobiota bacterium]|nr:MAG: citrate synthase [Candidatus Tectomicrobia bacterium]